MERAAFLLLATAAFVPSSLTASISSIVASSPPEVRRFPVAPAVLPLKTKTSQRGTSRRRRSVDLVDSSNQRTFLIEVSLGGQSVDLAVDTGSSNTWAASEGYTCGAGYVCDFGKPIQVDDNFELLEGSSFSTSYVDGSSGTGVLANTTVEIAGVKVPEQTIGLVDSLSFSGDGLMSGLVGLAYPGLTSGTEDSTPITYSSLLNTIFTEHLSNPLFAMAISRDVSQSGFGGYLTIGGVPNLLDSLVNASSTYGSAPIEVNPEFSGPQELTDYAIAVDSISWSNWRGVAAQNATSSLFTIDSGTTLTHVADLDAAAINALFEPPATWNSKGFWQVPCTATPPEIFFTVGGVPLPVNPIDLILNGEGICYCSIQPLVPSFPVGILGTTVLRSMLAVFDWGSR